MGDDMVALEENMPRAIETLWMSTWLTPEPHAKKAATMVKDLEETISERYAKRKTCALVVENPDIEQENTEAPLNRCI